jgi:hypothetical protein
MWTKPAHAATALALAFGLAAASPAFALFGSKPKTPAARAAAGAPDARAPDAKASDA